MPAFTSAKFLAILLSLKVAIVATLVSLPFGFGVAYLMTYRQFRGKVALDVAVTAQGERIGVFGPSGSGKSTLVSLLAGLQQPDSGIIRLDDELLFDSHGATNVPPEQRRIGIVFQRPYLFPHMSVKGNLLYGYKRSAPANRRIDFDSLVAVLQIGHLGE